MDVDFLNLQLEQLVTSLIQVNDMISSLNDEIDDFNDEDYISLISGRCGIIDSIIALNLLRYDNIANIDSTTDSNFMIGSIVLAPRYLLQSKQLCMDLAITLSLDEISDKIYISWLKPYNHYELNASSTSISYYFSQIRHETIAMKRLKSDMSYLNRVRLGDTLLCKVKQKGIWVQGLVMETYSESNESYLKVKLFFSFDHTKIDDYSVNIREVSPFPGNDTVSMMQSSISNTLISSNGSCNDGRVYSGQQSTSHSDGDDDDEVKEFNYALSRKPSYSEINNNNNTAINLDDVTASSFMDSNELLAELAKFGTWEKYTRGIGTKVLSRMGYKR